MAEKEDGKIKTQTQPEEKLWHSFGVEKILLETKTTRQGLKNKEAVRRLKKMGPNKLPDKKPISGVFIFLNQFKSSMVYILLAAGIVTLIFKNYIDTGIILAAVVVNTLVGFIQEYKANRAISHLKKLIQRKAKVLRDGIEVEIDASQIVRGDIILIEAGDRAPADARIIESMNLQMVEAALTGESVPSAKSSEKLDQGIGLADRDNMIYMGTNVTRGRGKAIVCETGVGTELGKIAQLVRETEEERTPLQKKLTRFSRVLGIVVLAISFLIFILGYFRGEPAVKMFETAVAIAVAAIPEGLLVSITVILAIGMQRILKKKALVRKLIAAETLGSTTVIASDKTGTLTEGKMQVGELVAGLGDLTGDKDGVFDAGDKYWVKAHELTLRVGLLCNNAVVENPKDELKNWSVIGDPTEVALLLAGIHAGLDKEQILENNPRVAEFAFDSEKKFMATLHRVVKDKGFIAMKGAPEEILRRASKVQVDGEAKVLTTEMRKAIKARYEKMTRQGLRVLGLSYRMVDEGERGISEKRKDPSVRLGTGKREREGDANAVEISEGDLNNMVFLGLVGLKDPVRAEAKGAIELCRKAGIRPMIITGDHKLTAQAVAKEIGIKAETDKILNGEELDKMEDKDLLKAVKSVDIFARVSPHHKLRIIDALQEQGEVVAMTGDGVNDAPAIKAADIGLALGSGTDVTKGTADMILMDNNYKTIVAAVEQGRIIFDNIKKVILYLLSGSFSEMILVGGALLLGMPLPLTAAQILWINLVTDGLPDIALTFEPGEKDIMDEPPRKKDRFLDSEMKVLIFIIGIITDLFLFGIYFYLMGRSADLAHIQTLIFTTLAMASLFFVFACKSIRHTLFSTKILNNLWLIGAVGVAFGLQLIAVYVPFFQKILRTVPLTLEDWILVGVVGVVNILAIEFGKWIFILRRRRHKRELT